MVLNQIEPPPTMNEFCVEYLLPATVGQEAFWYLDRLHPGNPAYNIAVRFRILGRFQTEAAERALSDVIHRHEALRTTIITEDGELFQRVSPPTEYSLPIDILNCAFESGRCEEAMATEASYSFSLDTGPLFRARLLQLNEVDHVLLFTMHHIVTDGWSTGIILNEFASLYAAYTDGQQLQLPELPLQYGDFAVWQAEYLTTPGVAVQLEYWKKQLSAIEPLYIAKDNQYPSDLPRRGSIESLLLPRDLTDQLAQLSHRQGVTVFSTYLACLNVLLQLRCNRDDILVGTLVAGRSRTELEPLVGLFVNTLVLRTNLAGNPTFLELLSRVRRTISDAMSNQDVPFGQVVENVSVKRQRGQQPLFGVNFLFQSAFLKPHQVGNVTITPIPSLSPGAIVDLNLFMVERDEGWRISCEYCVGEYSTKRVRDLLFDFRSILNSVAKNPGLHINELNAGSVQQNKHTDGLIASHNKQVTKVNGSAETHTTSASQHTVKPSPSVSSPTCDELEIRLIEIWREVLNIGRIDVTDDFFDLGGHSLTAARFVAKLQHRVGVKLNPTTVFEHPTIQQLAIVIRTMAGQTHTSCISPNILRSTVAAVKDINVLKNENGTRAQTANNTSIHTTENWIPNENIPNPFFFTTPDGQLYGVHTPPVCVDRGEGVVICSPIGHEYITTHWCLRLLASELSRIGFHVLRFDYSCMGHSWGEFDSSLASRWVRDITSAMQELRERADVPAISLMGIRFGGMLACLASRKQHVNQLILWDPVVDGREYVAQLRRMQHKVGQDLSGGIVGRFEELLGYLYPAELLAEVVSFEMISNQPQCNHVGLLCTDLSPSTDRMVKYLLEHGMRPNIVSGPNRGRWEDPNAHTLHFVLPQERRLIVDLLGGTAR